LGLTNLLDREVQTFSTRCKVRGFHGTNEPWSKVYLSVQSQKDDSVLLSEPCSKAHMEVRNGRSGFTTITNRVFTILIDCPALVIDARSFK
jgi:hypothetical protein